MLASFWLPAACLAIAATGCVNVPRAPGATGWVVDADTGNPVWQATVLRLADRPPSPATNATASLKHVFRDREEFAAAVYTSRDGSFTMHPASALELTRLVPGLAGEKSPVLTATFQIIAEGYATNQFEVVATRTNHWRKDLQTIELISKKPKAAGKGDCDCQ
jgi:hypothetical protein